MSPDRILPGSAGPPPQQGREPLPPPFLPPRETEEAPEMPPGKGRPPVAPPPTAEGPIPGATAPAPESGVPGRAPRRRGPLRRLYFGQTRFDFVRRKRWWFALSSIVIVAGVISLATRGLNLDIEFAGGTAWTVQTSTVSVTQARNALAPYGLAGAAITQLGTPPKTLNVEAKLPKGQTSKQSQAIAAEVSAVLAKLAHVSPASVSVETVGPSWGRQITSKALEALIVFIILVSVYISIFFEWRMAFAAILAMFHDILVTVGVYSLVGFDVTPDTVVAFLTILGYSLYDTIVVFDRVRDNAHHLAQRDRMAFSDLVNLSMNQTLARSLNTSLVAILPILSVLVLGAQVLGATTLQYFGLALLIGLTTGAYSSIFIASPLVALLKERETHYRHLAERLRNRGIGPVLLSPAAVAAGALGMELPTAGGREPAFVASRVRPVGTPPRRPETPAAAQAVAPTAPPARPAGPARPVRASKNRPAARRRRRGGRR
ncbi:MAG TPA: protein translocase subunit SecF [Acidimicrobiales bacterium]|nr:protein translocase subunit SecF [Acidimicrobiales bacterium]